MPRGLEKWLKSRNHNFSRQRRYRAPFSFAMQSDYSQYPPFNISDYSLLRHRQRIEVAPKGTALVCTLQPRRHRVAEPFGETRPVTACCGH